MAGSVTFSLGAGFGFGLRVGVGAPGAGESSMPLVFLFNDLASCKNKKMYTSEQNIDDY